MKGATKCLLLGALFVLSLIGFSTYSSTDASAASVYDNIIVPATSPYKVRYQNMTPRSFETPFDIGVHLGSYENPDAILNDTWGFCSTSNSLLAGKVYYAIQALGDGNPYWIMAQQNSNSSAEELIRVIVDMNPNASNNYVWYEAGYLYVESTTNTLIEFTIQTRNNSTSGLCIQNSEVQQMFISQSGSSMRFVETNVPITNYPAGYEGYQPVAVEPEEPPLEAQPDIYMSSMNNFEGTFSDRKFLTFDGYPFLCGEFAPQINIEVWKGHGGDDEELLDTISTSASSQFTYTFPTALETRDYRIVSWYSCPEREFIGVAFYDFQINSSGGLVGATPCSSELFCSLNLPTYGLTETILSPLAFVSQIPTATCAPLTLPMPFGIQNINLPCMTPIYASNFGALLLIYQTVLTGLFAYYVSLKMFGNVKELANPRDDQVETVKL